MDEPERQLEKITGKNPRLEFVSEQRNPARARIPIGYCDGAEGGNRTPTGFPTTASTHLSSRM
jgi:hypothetical protein